MINFAVMLNTKQFNYNKDTKTFFAEHTDLFKPLAPTPRRIVLTSQNTGHQVAYEYSQAQKDLEGDVLCWIYRTHQGLTHHQGALGTQLVIYND